MPSVFIAKRTKQGGKEHVTLQSCSAMKCLLVEGRGGLLCRHHLTMAQELLHTQMVHSSKRTLVWGWQKRTKIARVLKETLTNQPSIKEAMWRRQGRQLLRYFSSTIPLSSIIQIRFRAQGIGDLIPWPFSSKFPFHLPVEVKPVQVVSKC